MPLTAAEKQRRYRQRLKEKDSEAVKEKERTRWHQRKAQGKVKTINDMTLRQQRAKRKQWKQWNARRAAERQCSEDERENDESSDLRDASMSLDTSAVSSSSQTPSSSRMPSRQAVRGRKEKRRDRSSAFRRIDKLETEVLKLKRSCDKFRKRAERAKLDKRLRDSDTEENSEQDTPSKKARKMSRHPKLRNILKFHYSMVAQLKQRYSDLRKTRESSSILAKLFGTGSILKKYRTIDAAKRAFGLSREALNRQTSDVTTLKPEPIIQRRRALNNVVVNVVKSFYLNEDVSRPTAGKKETVTRRKLKKQKQFLLEPLSRTYKKFRQEHPTTVISLASFPRLRPFWVVRPRIQDRDTCRCQTCDNISFMHGRLKELSLVTGLTPRTQFIDICCSIDSKDCMYRVCDNCCKKEPKILTPEVKSTKSITDVIWWWQWRSVSEELGDKVIKKTKKIRVQGPVCDLVKAYNASMQIFTKHCFNIKHQQYTCRMKRINLLENELWLHIDFAENWCSKNLSEVQAAHFGGSHSQLSLHTCVAYSGSFLAPRTICSVSDNTNHGPVAIWNHLMPVLSDLKREFPRLVKLHFMSDGPVTQYRGRGNIHLLANLPYDLGFEVVYWNFSEASHGKGAADGVGAGIKRLCDNLVLSGKEIADAKSVCNAIENLSNSRIYEIDPDFNGISLPEKTIPALNGIMRVHQVVSAQRGSVYTREVSCYCDDKCQCFNPVKRNVLCFQQQSPSYLQTSVHVKESLEASVPVIESPESLHPVQSIELLASWQFPVQAIESMQFPLQSIESPELLQSPVQGNESLEASVKGIESLESPVQSIESPELLQSPVQGNESLEASVKGIELLESPVQSVESPDLLQSPVQVNQSLEASVHGLESLEFPVRAIESLQSPISNVGQLQSPVQDFKQLYKPGMWVVISYNGTNFPGTLEEIADDEYRVKCMKPAGNSGGWTWPPRPDECWYTDVQLIQPPIESLTLSNKRRIVYCFQDL